MEVSEDKKTTHSYALVGECPVQGVAHLFKTGLTEKEVKASLLLGRALITVAQSPKTLTVVKHTTEAMDW